MAIISPAAGATSCPTEPAEKIWMGSRDAYDVVALQESDAGSLRTGFTNQTEYLARQSCFPYWLDQTNRHLGHFAKHSNGLLIR